VPRAPLNSLVRYLDRLAGSAAVDQTDAEEDAGFDLVCHLMNSSTGHSNGGASNDRALARLLVRTRVPGGQSADSATGLITASRLVEPSW
jgi:NADH-quinone oxidoreductase subunit C